MHWIIFFALIVGASSTAYGQCLINGMQYAEDEPDPNNPCLVCDSAQSAMQFSPRDCSATMTTECEVPACRQGTCVALALPEHTRCSNPVCLNGEITQSECDAAGTCQPGILKRSCGGFGCENQSACAQACTDDRSCSTGFECDTAQQVCVPTDEPDMGGQPDVGFPDVGQNNGNNVNNSNNINNSNNVNNQNNGNNQNNANNQNNNTGGSGGDSGCCATHSTPKSAWVFGLLLIGFGAIRRRVIS